MSQGKRVAPLQEPQVTEEEGSQEMHATCEGLWTGLLGATCHGLNTAHVKTEREGFEYSKWHLTSGALSVRAATPLSCKSMPRGVCGCWVPQQCCWRCTAGPFFPTWQGGG